MNFIPRDAEKTLKELAEQFPALVITGPRQSGKTEITKKVFSNKPYVSLEDLDTRHFANEDPRGFLNQYEDGAIFDEVQRAPELFSYLQGYIDQNKKSGQYILTGSQQFGLMSGVSQSLAGRVAKISLLPFSYTELQKVGKEPETVEELLFKGLYPPIYDHDYDPNIWINNYIDTYVERDVRLLINVRDLSSFQRFLAMCAARSGQIVNLTSLANDCGITHNTAKAWISVLEASYIIHLLQPHYKNFNKRLVKSPKLYFYDAGLAARLLGVENAEQLKTHSIRGPLFETWVVSELLKNRYNEGKRSNLYFWRDKTGNEIDILTDQGQTLFPVEVKSGETIAKDYFRNIERYLEYAGEEAKRSALIYAGEKEQTRKMTDVIGWRNIGKMRT
jgi:predicted AAA+ superfamily ATPase